MPNNCYVIWPIINSFGRTWYFYYIHSPHIHHHTRSESGSCTSHRSLTFISMQHLSPSQTCDSLSPLHLHSDKSLHVFAPLSKKPPSIFLIQNPLLLWVIIFYISTRLNSYLQVVLHLMLPMSLLVDSNMEVWPKMISRELWRTNFLILIIAKRPWLSKPSLDLRRWFILTNPSGTGCYCSYLRSWWVFAT